MLTPLSWLAQRLCWVLVEDCGCWTMQFVSGGAGFELWQQHSSGLFKGAWPCYWLPPLLQEVEMGFSGAVGGSPELGSCGHSPGWDRKAGGGCCLSPGPGVVAFQGSLRWWLLAESAWIRQKTTAPR